MKKFEKPFEIMEVQFSFKIYLNLSEEFIKLNILQN